MNDKRFVKLVMSDIVTELLKEDKDRIIKVFEGKDLYYLQHILDKILDIYQIGNEPDLLKIEKEVFDRLKEYVYFNKRIEEGNNNYD